MQYFALPGRYDDLMADIKHHFENVDEDGRIVVVSYIMPCDAIMAMVSEAASRGVQTLVAVDRQHAQPGATPVQCFESDAMHAKYIVAGETCIVGSWNFGKRGGVDSVFIQECDLELALELMNEADNLVGETQLRDQVYEEVRAVAPWVPGKFGRSVRGRLARTGKITGPQIAALLHKRGR